jgi:uncharacterized protein
MKTGIAHLPLHGGKAPRWLFERMVKLARQITLILIEEYSAEEVLRRLSDPHWFQAFGCVLGFDWHSSGLTTTVGGALKESLRGIERASGIFVAGGKGKTSRKTPDEIRWFCEKIGRDAEPLIEASRLAAKVDSAAVQDGYQLYHHNFIFTAKGEWCVVQQGMNAQNKYARRYHWLSERVESFVSDPHAAICTQAREANVLNMAAKDSEASRAVSAELARRRPEQSIAELQKIQILDLPRRHEIKESEDINPKYLHKILLKTYERQPENFQALLRMEGVGAKTIRALALIGELVYGKKPSFSDPARYSFAHGGKDGIPYPVDRKTYDQSIDILRRALARAKLDRSDKDPAFRRLDLFAQPKLLDV